MGLSNDFFREKRGKTLICVNKSGFFEKISREIIATIEKPSTFAPVFVRIHRFKGFH